MKAGMSSDARKLVDTHKAAKKEVSHWVGTLDPGSKTYYYYNTATQARRGAQREGAAVSCWAPARRL